MQALLLEAAWANGYTGRNFRDSRSVLRCLQFSVPRADTLRFGKCRLRITWDDAATPSVDAPVALFFGAGTLYNRDGREYLVKGLPIHVRYDEQRVHLACFYPMPFFKSARIELLGNAGKPITDVQTICRWEPYHGPDWHVGHFHATYTDHPKPRRGHDLLLLDTEGVEGGGEWSGQFVGMSWIFSHRGVLRTLEGDPRFFFDDSGTPQAYGTGTEEWGGGGDYWGGRNMTLPLAGHPVGCRKPEEAKSPENLIQSAYRFLLADLMPFGRRAVIQLEHGGKNESTEHYESVVYWYGRRAASLVKTDELDVGSAASEQAHQYTSPEASEVVRFTSRYEWGVDTLDGEEIYPPHTEDGRFTRGSSEFVLKLRPDNVGMMLRRTMDYAFPNQRAEIYVADARAPQDGSQRNWQSAGVWYTAGSNTCVYSNPKPETGATEHHVQTSNRRFRDDEFLIPRDLTQGRDAIAVRVVFTPVDRPLFPGFTIDEQLKLVEPALPYLAWSELRYAAYCFVRPK